MSKKITFLIFLFSGLCFSQSTDLPENPEPGKCYVTIEEEKDDYKWREIKCSLIYWNELKINISSEVKEISKNDKEIIDKKIINLIRNKFIVEIEINHDSKENDSINMKLSNVKGQLLADYFNNLKIPTKTVIITSFGNEKAEKKCVHKERNCDKLYKKNSKINYRVILSDPEKGSNYLYNEKLGKYYWFETKE